MKIDVKYVPKKEDVLVWGVYGQHTIEKILKMLSGEIEKVNQGLRKLYE